MLPVKHLASKILLVVNYCGRQLARRLGWAAPAYHRKEGYCHPASGSVQTYLVVGGLFWVQVVIVILKEECYGSFVGRKNYAYQVHGLRESKRTFRMRENKTEIDFVLIKKNTEGLFDM